ncbi:unnamed protein product, partial [Prorocentrum cordatum]
AFEVHSTPALPAAILVGLPGYTCRFFLPGGSYPSWGRSDAIQLTEARFLDGESLPLSGVPTRYRRGGGACIYACSTCNGTDLTGAVASNPCLNDGVNVDYSTTRNMQLGAYIQYDGVSWATLPRYVRLGRGEVENWRWPRPVTVSVAGAGAFTDCAALAVPSAVAAYAFYVAGIGGTACSDLATLGIPAPTPTPVPAASVSATADPHLVNVLGQRFDILQPGVHALLAIPRSLGVGGKCADMYFQTLNMTGWRVAWGRTNEDIKSINFLVRHLRRTTHNTGAARRAGVERIGAIGRLGRARPPGERGAPPAVAEGGGARSAAAWPWGPACEAGVQSECPPARSPRCGRA